MNKCKYLRIRTKNYKRYYYCALNKVILEENECGICNTREYKKMSKIGIKKKNTMGIKKTPIKGKIHKLTKATSIPTSVKQKVWDRDKHKCISCGIYVPVECACSHIVKRSQLGLGIEENIITQCNTCHKRFDDTILRNDMLISISRYMESIYPNWNMDDLKYKKN